MLRHLVDVRALLNFKSAFFLLSKHDIGENGLYGKGGTEYQWLNESLDKLGLTHPILYAQKITVVFTVHISYLEQLGSCWDRFRSSSFN